MEASPQHREILRGLTPASYTFIILIIYGVGLMLTVKYILAETYDFYLYFVTISLFTQVRDSATKAVSSGCPLEIEKWLQEHHTCCRFISIALFSFNLHSKSKYVKWACFLIKIKTNFKYFKQKQQLPLQNIVN